MTAFSLWPSAICRNSVSFGTKHILKAECAGFCGLSGCGNAYKGLRELMQGKARCGAAYPEPSLDERKKVVTTDIGATTRNFFSMTCSDLAVHPAYPSVPWDKMFRCLKKG